MGVLFKAIGDIFRFSSRPPNAYMWDGRPSPFYNRWWLKLNAEDGDAFSIQVVVNNPWDTEKRWENTGVYIFFDRFSRIEERNLMSMPEFPLSAFSAEAGRFEVRVGESRFSAERFSGAFRDEDHDKDVSFDLKISDAKPFLLKGVGLDGITESRVANTLWQAPMATCSISGTIRIDSEVIEFDEVPGYEDTFWGSSVPDRWFWGQCNKFQEDPQAWIVIGAGQLELLGAKVPRLLDSESFPMVIEVALGGRPIRFNSVFNRTRYQFDKGRIRVDIRKRLKGVRVVYESEVPRDTLRHMDWESPDDTALESGMSLTAPAKMEVYEKGLFGKWRLEKSLTSENAGSICGGAKMDRISTPRPFWNGLWKPFAQLLYIGAFYFRGLFSGRR